MNTTVVNDNTVRIYASAEGNEDETAVRRLAGDLERGDNRIDRVGSSVTNYGTVWLAAEGEHFAPPDGYEIDKVYVDDGGGVAVDIDKVDA